MTCKSLYHGLTAGLNKLAVAAWSLRKITLLLYYNTVFLILKVHQNFSKNGEKTKNNHHSIYQQSSSFPVMWAADVAATDLNSGVWGIAVKQSFKMARKAKSDHSTCY